jgi:MinD-like ATPase involved in chromosome partitioning or flagellar assembly
VKLSLLTAADGAAWESGLMLALESDDLPVTVARRCVDIVDLLAVALSGQARAALVSGGLRRLDPDAVDRLRAASVAVVAVYPRGDARAEDRLRAMGIEHLVPADADVKVIVSVLEQAVRELDGAGRDPSPRGYADPAGATASVLPPEPAATPVESPERDGSVAVVWGPTGAPGRSTVAIGLADELSRLGRTAVLVDADVYGGVLAPSLGLLDESPGLAAACRQAGQSRLGPDDLAALCWQISPTLRVLTGIPRPDRWTELRPSAVPNVLAAARRLADFTVVDVGFCLETDEELSYDTVAPRRNGLTLAMLDAADLVIAVGAADPLGVQRLVRGLGELRDAEVAAPVWVVMNKVRKGTVPGDPGREITAALDRFAGRSAAALLPNDQEAVDACVAVGKTLGEARASSPLRRALTELSAAVAGVPVPSGRRHARG